MGLDHLIILQGQILLGAIAMAIVVAVGALVIGPPPKRRRRRRHLTLKA